MDTEEEQGGDKEEPSGKDREESDSKESDCRPTSKYTGQTGSDDDDEMSRTSQVEVAPHMPSPYKADLVNVFTRVLGFSVKSVKLLVIEQDLVVSQTVRHFQQTCSLLCPRKRNS